MIISIAMSQCGLFSLNPSQLSQQVLFFSKKYLPQDGNEMREALLSVKSTLHKLHTIDYTNECNDKIVTTSNHKNHFTIKILLTAFIAGDLHMCDITISQYVMTILDVCTNIYHCH